MATTLLCGFEAGSLGECYLTSGSVSVQSSTVRSGAYALRINPSASNGSAGFKSIAAGGSARNSFRSFRFYLYFSSLPTGLSNVVIAGLYPSASIPSGYRIALSGTGASPASVFSVIADDGGTTQGSTAITTGQWYEICVDIGYTSSVGIRLYINRVLECSRATGTSTTAGPDFCIGVGSGSFTYDMFVDDVMVDDAAFNGTLPATSKQLVLLPTADPVSLNSWTNGGGGTTSIFEGVNNVPPTGAAASTNGIKIKNAASGANLDYVATMQTYTAAGVPRGSAINAVMAICNDGEEAGTATKAGAVWIASNPSQTAGTGTFDYGNDGGALGTFPTGWVTHFGVVTASPSVTLGTAPTVTVRKTTSTTRVVDVDFLGLYVDYTPPNPFNSTPPVPPLAVFPSIVGF